jgi:hypothetical protein
MLQASCFMLPGFQASGFNTESDAETGGFGLPYWVLVSCVSWCWSVRDGYGMAWKPMLDCRSPVQSGVASFSLAAQWPRPAAPRPARLIRR